MTLTSFLKETCPNLVLFRDAAKRLSLVVRRNRSSAAECWRRSCAKPLVKRYPLGSRRVKSGRTGPLSDLRYRQVRLDLRFIVRMRARQAPLPPIPADCHRLLPAIIVAWEISRGMATNGYQIIVVQALTEQIPEPIVFWFVIFGFVTKCVIHCMFELKDLKLEVAR